MTVHIIKAGNLKNRPSAKTKDVEGETPYTTAFL